MFAGKKVKVRFRRYLPEERVRIFLGTILEMNNDWLKAKGKMYYLVKGIATPNVDDNNKVVGIPRESITLIRELPNSLDLDNLSFDIKEMRMVVKVPTAGEDDVSISE